MYTALNIPKEYNINKKYCPVSLGEKLTTLAILSETSQTITTIYILIGN